MARKLDEVFRIDENVNIDGTTIKTEPREVTATADVVSGSWLSEQEQPILPDIGPQSGWESAVLVPIKQEVPDDEPDLSDDEDPILPIPIPTKVTNYHLEVSGLCVRSPQDSGSDLDSNDESLATNDVPQANDDVAQATDEVPQATDDVPEATDDDPLATDNVPLLATIKQEIEIEIEGPAVNPAPNKEITGAIKVVTLTHREVIGERQMERNSKSFLRNAFRCETCIISFVLESLLNEHNASNHQVFENSFKCNICESVFLKNGALKTHEEKIHYTRYECGVCQKRYSQGNAINDHYNKMHRTVTTNSDIAIKYCDECDYFTPHGCALKSHKLKCHSDNLVCDCCSTKFSSKSALIKHMSQIASKIKKEDLSALLAEYKREREEKRAEYLSKQAQRHREYRKARKSHPETRAEYLSKEAQRLREYRARKKLLSTKMEAERKRKYRARKRATLQPDERAELLSKEAQRLREYRARKKGLPTSNAQNATACSM